MRSKPKTEWPEPKWMRVPDHEMSLRRPLVLVNGAFDIFHSGHAKLLREARVKAGKGTVVMAMDSDARVRAAKGPGRPIMSWVERAVMLQYQPVDYIVEIESDEDMVRLIDALKPDLRIQGSEYVDTCSKFPDIPKNYIERRGMSTSEIIRRCRRAHD